ncbi:MAG: hypothetical protein LQ346_001722 [Caloplaca aetnensis]|nr:MAG: hypothetical protein LQ346_001722 [Caloplaca aetnensis]
MLLPGRKVTFFSKARSLALGCVAFATLTAARVSSDEKASYAPGQAIPVSCLNRTILRTRLASSNISPSQPVTRRTAPSNSFSASKKVPFPPSLSSARLVTIDPDTNCTISSISDEFFHLLEFYVHNDAPLTCRIPTHPLLSSVGTSAITPSSNPAVQDDYIPLIFALAGTLQYSHLHINTRINVVLHTSPDLVKEEADIIAATGYSVPSLSTTSTKIVIG